MKGAVDARLHLHSHQGSDMNSKSVLAALMAMSLGLGNVAFAQPNDPPNVRDSLRQGNQPRGQQNVQRPRPSQNMQRGQRADQSAERGPGTYQNDRRGASGYQPPRGPGAHQNAERGPGAGPDRNFYRGERLPREYRHNNYVVDDWRGHHLSPPPRGYHWVQTGSDYVLVAIATGIIMQILLNQ